METVRVISATNVPASSHNNQFQRIELTPWDLQFLLVGPIQKGLLFLNPKPSQENKKSDNTSLIKHLKSSLSRTLNFFTPLAGRLATIEKDDMSSFFIDCNKKGALFVHARADFVTIANILEPNYVPSIVHSFFPLNGIKNYEGISNPLLAVQITELEDGIFIGCTINHAVADGSSFWHFLNSWSEISRGFVNISKIPVLDRWFLDGANCPIKIPRLIDQETYSDRFILPQLKERVFHFTKENIAELKNGANAEVGTDKISSLQALLTHLWLSIVRSRNLEPNQETTFKLFVGARQRLNPPLSTEYFGNAIQAGSLSLKNRELLENGIGYAAWKINRVVAWHTEEKKLRDFLKDWIENPKILNIENLTRNALVTSSSPRFNVYGNDFGWGRPIAVRSGAGNKYDGKITVFPGVEEGSVDIEACLAPETLQAMENDSEFMAAA